MACEERILEELSNNLIFVVFYTSLKFGAVPLFIVLHYTTLYYVVLQHMILYYIVFYFIILSNNEHTV